METQELKEQIRDALLRLKSPFFCTGHLNLPAAVQLAYKLGGPDSSAAHWLELPCLEAGGLQKLVSACSDASFGKGAETVIDSTYRKSLKLEPHQFLTNFRILEYDILNIIKRLLAPPSTESIKAELHRLNVYREGDFFKPHVDTPRHGTFASLVVGLPTAFSGGELLIRHISRSRKNQDFDTEEFEWGEQEGNSNRIYWVAFYSDCEHEVKPVTSGFRITLTYNLCIAPEYGNKKDETRADVAVDLSKLDLYDTFKCSLDKYRGPSITLGFPCLYQYPFTLQKIGARRLSDTIGNLLKGEDGVLYECARALGLKPRLCRVWKPSDTDASGEPLYYVDASFDGVPSLQCGYYYEEGSVDVFVELGDRLDDADIEWCMEVDDRANWEVGGGYGAYGNDATTSTLYCAVCMLMDVDERHKRAKTS